MSLAPTQQPPSGKCPLCARAVPIGHPCTYFVCQGYQKNGIPVEDADAALKLKADRSHRGEYTLSHVGRWFGEWLVLSAVSGDRNGPIFKAIRRVHPRKLEVRAEPSALRIFTSDVWHEVRHLAEEQLSWRFPRVVSWDAVGDVGGQGWASHRWLGHYSLLSERLLPGRPLMDVEPTLADAALSALFEGLVSMHGAGIAHGAVRPDQIAFLERGTKVEALLLGPSDLPFYVPTQQAPGGADAGLAWAAPERFDEAAGGDDPEGDDEAPEPLSGDVYSAALIVAELVAGRRPFALPTLHVRRQKRETSADPLATSRALLPPALREVLDAATRFDPASRIPDAAALQARLLPLLRTPLPRTPQSQPLPPPTRVEERPTAVFPLTVPAPATRAPTSPAPTSPAPTSPAPTDPGTSDAPPTPQLPAADLAASETHRGAPTPPPAAPVPDAVEPAPAQRAEPADAVRARLEVALEQAARTEAATRAIREAHATSDREWAERMAVVTGRLREAEVALSKAMVTESPAPLPPVSEPIPTRRAASRSWLLVGVAVVIGAFAGALAMRAMREPPLAVASAPLVVNARLSPSGGGTVVRIVVPTLASTGTLTGTLRLVGRETSREVAISRAITSAGRAEGVLLFDDTVPFVVHSVVVVSLTLE